jgi:hypothetical protein
LKYNAITLKVEANTGFDRSADIIVQAIDGSVSVKYTIEQAGEQGGEWTSLGNIDFADTWNGWVYPVEIEQNINDATLYRLVHPFDEGVAELSASYRGTPDPYWEFYILPAGSKIGDVTTTTDGLVYWEGIVTNGYTYGTGNGGPESYMHPATYGINQESKWKYNIVSKWSEDGKPLAIKIAPVIYYEEEAYGMDFSTYDGLITITFPQELPGEGDLEQGKSIDDYVGTYYAPVEDLEGGSGYLEATITKKDETTLLVKGLQPMPDYPDYDDTFELQYDPTTGLLTFLPQTVASLEGLSPIATPFNSSTYNLTTAETLVGGLLSTGELQFVNADTNTMVWDAISFFVDIEGDMYFLGGLWAYLTWIPSSAVEATAARAAAPSLNFNGKMTKVQPRPAFTPEKSLKSKLGKVTLTK